MKKNKLIFKIIVMLFCIQLNINCSSPSSSSSDDNDWKCGFYNGNQLWTGKLGGCYYINSNGNKTYVDRSNCKC